MATASKKTNDVRRIAPILIVAALGIAAWMLVGESGRNASPLREAARRPAPESRAGRIVWSNWQEDDPGAPEVRWPRSPDSGPEDRRMTELEPFLREHYHGTAVVVSKGGGDAR